MACRTSGDRELVGLLRLGIYKMFDHTAEPSIVFKQRAGWPLHDGQKTG